MTPEELKKLMDGLSGEIKGIEDNLMPLLTKQGEEIKAHGETSKATRDSIKDLEAKYDTRFKDLDGLRAQLDEIKTEFGELQLPTGRKRDDVALTPGQRFIQSEEFKNADMQNHQVMPVEMKALFTGAALTDELEGFLGSTFRQPGIIQGPDADLHIRDLLPVTPTDAASITYIRRTGDRFIAGVQTAEGEAKKEQALTFEQVQANPTTIAHWIPITRQALSRSAQLRAYIDNELLYGLKLAEDQQLLYGTGASGQLTGLMNTTGVQDYDASGKAQTGDTPIDTLRRAITLLRLGFYRPSGMIVHPNDWEAIELQKDLDARYIWVTVTDGGVPRLWRVPVVETPAIDEGSFLMGDFRIGAHLWDLEQARIDVGYVNDDFIKNRLVIRAEEDIIFTAELPGAFVKGSFDAEDGG